MLIRKQLYERDGAPPNTRTNPETGEVETSMDGGTTWTPNPDVDPRQNPAYQLPPNEETDPKCAAAAGMVENIRRVLDAGALGLGAGGLATVLITLLLIPGIGWMFAAMLLFAGSITLAIAAGTVAAFTEEVYEQLLCIFYANINTDGSVTAAQLEAIQDEIEAEITDPLVSAFTQIVFEMHGFVGFTNAGTAYADGEALCECDEGWCWEQVFGTAMGDWSVAHGNLTGAGIEGTLSGGIYRAAATHTLAQDITRLGIHWGGGCPGVFNVYVVDDTTSTVVFDVNEGTHPGGVAYNPSVSIPAGHALRWEVQCAGGSVTLVGAMIGDLEGTNPFGSDNCPEEA